LFTEKISEVTKKTSHATLPLRRMLMRRVETEQMYLQDKVEEVRQDRYTPDEEKGLVSLKQIN
jgi:hypothetical protein